MGSLLWGRCAICCAEMATGAALHQGQCGQKVLNVLWEMRRIFHADSVGTDFVQVQM